MPTREHPSNLSNRRSRRPTAAERREEILSEGLRCFAARGFNGTTTRRIAESVGITEAALYRYFRSKESLYSAIVARKIETPLLFDRAEDAARRRDDTAVFTALASGVLKGGTADPEFLRLLFFTALESHELAAPLFASHVDPLREFVTDYVRMRIAEGAFRPIDPLLGARAFLGMIRDYLNVRIVHGESEAYPQSLDEVVATFVDLFLTGVRADPR
ncbi:MAG: TetR/AcrR family transcriptional regulator [Deltaproteobacteria bacterium]|nr:TetR/AcrR family transcriptional regulator [Deltaproteobacteria bacterium]MBW2359276.1 TetR/AcrR family transcriptional regulator [Deltaproteobacteria bacterium]